MYNNYKFENKPLPYAYDALEPYIDTKTMQLHHDKHLQTYVDNLNKLLFDCQALQKFSLKQLVTCQGSIPLGIRQAVINNAGGVYNHNFFFEGMINGSNNKPEGELLRAMEWEYGGISGFKECFKKESLSVFGSGYCWLVSDRNRRLCIVKTANQDTPLIKGYCPILTLDLWEHAYYLKHFNQRAKYIEDWFEAVNWKKANERFIACCKGRS